MTEPYRLSQWLVYTEDSVTSTQKWVRERVSALSDRSIVLANSQTAGRGRSDRSWESPPGGFYASFLLKPSPPVAFAPCVSLLAAVILVRILKKHGISAEVKWPNDVIAEGKKIAGIIAEAGSYPESWFILGVGVNLMAVPDIPGRTFLPVGAWSDFGVPPSAPGLLEEFLTELDFAWKFKTSHPICGISDELGSILWRKNKHVSLTCGSEKHSGVISEIDDDGSLVLLTDSGERRFVSGELLTVPGERWKDD